MFKIYQYCISSRLLNICLMLSTIVLLTGCFATILSGSTQEIKMKVVDDNDNLVEKVKCVIRDPSETNHSLTSNPGTVVIHRGSGSLFVDCKKEDYKQLNVIVGESFNSVTLLNLLWLPGFAVDAITGAYKQYPSHYVVNMTKSD